MKHPNIESESSVSQSKKDRRPRSTVVAGQNLPLYMNQGDLANLVGCVQTTISDLSRTGTLVRLDDGTYETVKSVRAYCKRLQTLSAKRGTSDPELRAEQIRAKREQADALEMKNAETRRELIPAREVEATWLGVMRQVRSAMLAVPSRVRSRLPGATVDIIEAIDSEVRAALAGAEEEDLIG